MLEKLVQFFSRISVPLGRTHVKLVVPSLSWQCREQKATLKTYHMPAIMRRTKTNKLAGSLKSCVRLGSKTCCKGKLIAANANSINHVYPTDSAFSFLC